MVEHIPTLGNMDMIYLLVPLNTSPSLRTLYHQKQGVCEASLSLSLDQVISPSHPLSKLLEPINSLNPGG